MVNLPLSSKNGSKLELWVTINSIESNKFCLSKKLYHNILKALSEKSLIFEIIHSIFSTNTSFKLFCTNVMCLGTNIATAHCALNNPIRRFFLF